MNRPTLRAALAGAGAALALALLGALATDTGAWYQGLAQPAWKPPDAWFGPVWTLLYGLAAWSGVRAWRTAPDHRRRVTWLALLSLNAFLNLLWSLLFFRLQRPDLALAEVVLLGASCLSLVVYPWRWDRLAGALFLPYLAWVAFAGAVNAAVVRLNGPWGA